MPHQLSVALRLDGVVHAADLAVQSFARHVAEGLPAGRGKAVIAGMRGLLEDRPQLLASGGLTGADRTALRQADDGDQAVALLAAAAGLPTASIEAARWASRRDLAASAWVLDPMDGLDELLAAVNGRADVVVLSTRGDPAAGPVLDACGLTGRVHMVTELPHGRLLMIGTRWVGELADMQAAGAATAMVDRFGGNRGTPTWRATDLAGLVGPATTWCIDNSGGTP